MSDKINAASNCFILFNQPILPGQRECRGFSLVELLMVIAILGLLAAIIIPTLNSYVQSTRNKTCAADIRTIDKAIAAYMIENNSLPPDGLPGLIAIGMGNQQDPWKRSYEFHIIVPPATGLEAIVLGEPLNTDYDLYSKGEDGLSDPASAGVGNQDDIVRSNDGAFAGMRP